MNVILFDDKKLWKELLPLTFTRPISEIRVGILKIVEKWQAYSWDAVSYLTEDYLRPKFPSIVSSENLLINSKFLPSFELSADIKKLSLRETLMYDGEIVAHKCDNLELEEIIAGAPIAVLSGIEYQGQILKLNHVTDIFLMNGGQIKEDFKVITQGRSSAGINDGPTVTYSVRNIFVEEGVKIRAAVLNAEDGPIYLGRNSEIQEGALIKGPFAMGEGAVINMGGKMRQNTTIGPYCKVGGEVSNSVFFGYSNKAHDGFIGNTVIGEWCNLGADTNTSNLKNNYSEVKIWNYEAEDFQNTGLQFCGTIMGDHSKTGINTMLNTGTVIGVGSNIFGGGFPPKFIPCFSWGSAENLEEFKIEKNIEVAVLAMKRREISLTHAEKNILRHIFSITAHHRGVQVRDQQV